jgi:hypothetical protein
MTQTVYKVVRKLEDGTFISNIAQGEHQKVYQLGKRMRSVTPLFTFGTIYAAHMFSDNLDTILVCTTPRCYLLPYRLRLWEMDGASKSMVKKFWDDTEQLNWDVYATPYDTVGCHDLTPRRLLGADEHDPD